MGKRYLINKVIVFIIVNICIISSNTFLSYANLNFKNMTIENGINQATIESIFQDSNGYVWLGSNDGLNKYNGYEFKLYDYNEEENSITNNYINAITQDKKGYIWVTTINGVNKINLKNGEITNYTKENKNIGSNNGTDVIVTKDGKIIIGTESGLYVYDEAKDSFDRIFKEEGSIISQFIYCIDEDSNGNIWIGTALGVSKISKDFKTVKNYQIDFGSRDVSESKIHNIYCDSESGYLWIGSASSGLAKLDLKTDEIKIYKNNPSDESSIPDSQIGAILKDSKGNLWIGTGNGLAVYNEKDDNFKVYRNKIYDKNTLVNNNIKSLMEDRNGYIWVGTYSGISIFSIKNNIKTYKAGIDEDYLLSENIVHGIYEDEDGYLWVGTNSKGVNVINKERTHSKIINSVNTKNLVNDSINDIAGLGDDIYIATNKGLVKINKKTKELKTYTKDDGLVDENIKDVLVDSKGYVWIGTPDGLSILNSKDESIIDINDKINYGSDKNKYVRYIYEDSDGEYFLGFLREQGLCRINPKEKDIKFYKNIKSDKTSISNNFIRYINEDSKGNIWIGTSYGLNKFDKESETFKRYTTNDGLANNTIYGVLFDEDDNVWVSSNQGISKLDTKTNYIRNLSVVDGLQGNEFNGNASFKSKSGELFFGGVNGLNSFYPQDITKSNKNPEVVFDEFIVNGTSYDKDKIKKLSSDANTITIKFFNPDYSNTRNTTYEYKLEGTSGDIAYTKDNHVTYNDLYPGKYKFKIRAIDSNGNYSDFSSISFEIKPPIWFSKFAIFVYTLIIILLIYNHKNKVRRLDKLVNKKTIRLREEMERNNRLLNKNIKLERNKNSYFVNLSHELRTPLNIISSTNQLIEELVKKDAPIKKDSLKHYMDVSQRNCKRLLNLINNIIDSTKLQNEMYVISVKEVDIVYLVEETSLGLADYIKTKGIDLIIDPEIEEKIIMCDKHEIERCIVNLLGNATKFTPPGGTITVTIKDLDNKVMIIVEDTGVGIDEKHHKVIFDRFSQVVDLNNEVKGGSGLGLTITSHIVKLHMGEIYVESKLGEGSKFVIVLPVKPDIENNSEYKVESNIDQI